MKFESDRKHLFKYFRYFLSLLLIVSLLLTGIQYFYTDSLLQREAAANSENMFALIKYSHDVLFRQLDTSISGLFHNASFQNFSEYYRSNSVNRMCAVYDQLCDVMQSSDLIQNICLYYPTTGITVSTNQSLASLDAYHGRDFLLTLNGAAITGRKTFPRSVYYALSTTPVDVVSIVRTLPVIYTGSLPSAYVIIDLKMSALSSVFEEVTISNNASLIIFDELGAPISVVGQYYPFEDLLGESWTSSSDIAYTRVKQKGEELFVYYASTADTGWTYAYIQNASEFNNRLILMRNTSIIVCITVLALGLMLSWFASRQLYKPLERISHRLGGQDVDVFDRIDETIHRNEQLDQALQNNVITGRNQQVLQQMLMNLGPSTDEGDRLRLEPGETECALLLIGTDSDPENFSTENLAAPLTLIGLRPLIKLYTGEREIALIIAGDAQDHAGIKREKLLTAAQAVAGLCPAGACIGVSNGFSSVSQLSQAYHQARDALDMRLVRGKDSLCCFFEIRNRPTLDYPYRTENAILRAFKSYEIENVSRELQAFQDYLISHDAPASTVRDFYTQLICSFQHLLLELPSASVSTEAFSHRNILVMTAIQDMTDYLLNLFTAVMDNREKPDAKSEIIDRVCAYIAAHVKDAPTVDGLAAEFFMSPSSLRAEFQRVRGMSIKTYTDQLRLNMARELLLGGNRRVQDIAADLGFNYAQSFIAFFKGATGMTPGEYRAAGLAEKRPNLMAVSTEDTAESHAPAPDETQMLTARSLE